MLPGLVALVRGGAKEKVVRAGLLALARLLAAPKPAPDVVPALLELDLHKLVAIRSLQVLPSLTPLLPMVCSRPPVTVQHMWRSSDAAP